MLPSRIQNQAGMNGVAASMRDERRDPEPGTHLARLR